MICIDPITFEVSANYKGSVLYNLDTVYQNFWKVIPRENNTFLFCYDNCWFNNCDVYSFLKLIVVQPTYVTQKPIEEQVKYIKEKYQVRIKRDTFKECPFCKGMCFYDEERACDGYSGNISNLTKETPNFDEILGKFNFISKQREVLSKFETSLINQLGPLDTAQFKQMADISLVTASKLYKLQNPDLPLSTCYETVRNLSVSKEHDQE